VQRREFLAFAAAAVPGAVSNASAAGDIDPRTPQKYGSKHGRSSFRAFWRDLPGRGFEHREFDTFHRLRTTVDASYARSEQNILPLRMRPVRLSVKLLCMGDADRALFTLGLKSGIHGCWAFTLGAPGNSTHTGTEGQNVVNAAAPIQERVTLEGYDHHDWHTFVLTLASSAAPVRLYCDGYFLMELRQPITSSGRVRLAREQSSRHGSIQFTAPEVAGDNDYVFIESRLPGQVIDIDSFAISEEPVSTSRTLIPVLLDLDWELNNVQIVENTPARYSGNPILTPADLPSLSGQPYSLLHPRVLRDETGFHMYFPGTLNWTENHPLIEGAIFHAFSEDGLKWEITPKEPVLRPGTSGDWDAGALGQCCVLKDAGTFRMWYGGYVPRLSQGRGGYAVSSDGIHWEKPRLGLHRFEGRETNIVVPLNVDAYSDEYELPHSIVRDDDSNTPPERRYVLFLHTQGPAGFIVDVMTSPDGIHFKRSEHNVRYNGFDLSKRGSTLHEAAVALHEPNYWWAFVGHHERPGGLESYKIRFTGWAVDPEERDNISFGLWRNRRVHLDPIPNSWEGVSTHAGCVLPVGDEWWIYYTSSWASQPVSIGLATIGRHRMFGLELLRSRERGYATSIAFQTPAGGWKARHFEINVSSFAGGTAIQAELLDAKSGGTIPGFGFEDCLPVDREGYSIPLRWHGGVLPVNRVGRALRVRFRFTRGAGSPQLHSLALKPFE